MSTELLVERRILDSRWALQAESRKGASACVYRAVDIRGEYEGRIAVKIVAGMAGGDERLAAMYFDREQRTLTQLDHPHIVQLLDGGRDPESGERYFVFPWFEHDLGSLLKSDGPLPWERWWLQYGCPLLEALTYAHDHHVAHRDLKPGNVLIGAEGQPLLADFGIAKLTSDVNIGATLLGHGTPPYSPRDYEDERFNTQRDVHAFGALCTLAVTGAEPHAAGVDPFEVLDQAFKDLDAPEKVRDVIASSLVREPASRPANAGLLLARFERCSSSSARSRTQAELPLTLSPKARGVLIDELSLRRADDLLTALNAELAAEASLVPFDKPFSDGTPPDGHYYIYAGELKLHCKIATPRRDSLEVVNGWRLPASLVESKMLQGLILDVAMRFASPRDPEAAVRLLAELEEGAHRALAEYRRSLREESRSASLRIWGRILSASRAVLREREVPFDYQAMSIRRNGEIKFDLVEDLAERLVDETRLLLVTEDDLPLAADIVARGERSVTVRVHEGDWSAIEAQGKLKIDTRASRVSLRRQDAALDALRFGHALRRDLKALLIDPAAARPPDPVASLSLVRKDLDQPKRDAVAAALGAQDILLVEGPPGTGKTTFITELVLAEIARNPKIRILIAAQTHAALDNVLERVTASADIKAVRIARRDEPRVGEKARELLVDAQLKHWREDGVKSGRSWLKRWAARHGLDVEQLETSIRLDELASALRRRRELASERTSLQTRLDELRRLRREAPDGTDAETVRTAAEQLDELVQSIGVAGDDARQKAERLVELEAARDAVALQRSDPEELRRQALAGLPEDRAVARQARTLLGLLGDWHARLGSHEFSAAVLVRAQVVAATCVGYAGVPGSDTVEFDLCIVDEASKATATELLVPMTRAARWVLVGDHKQLPPFVDDALEQPEMLNDNRLTREDLRRTLFDELRRDLPGSCHKTLTSQHRMLPAIGNLISEVFYEESLDSAPRSTPSYVTALAGVPVAWHTTAGSGARGEERTARTMRNQYEARCIRSLLRRLDFYAAADRRRLEVAVLSGYRGQVAHLERLLADDEPERHNIDVTVSTIDAFQGREAHVVLYSVTRSNALGQIGFLRERRRLNVALSRARDLLLIVGDHVTAGAAGGDNPLREVLDYIDEHPRDCVLCEATP